VFGEQRGVKPYQNKPKTTARNDALTWKRLPSGICPSLYLPHSSPMQRGLQMVEPYP
jgi:hypothetical protein